MKDYCRERVLLALKEHTTLPSKRIVEMIRQCHPNEVEGTLIELSFEGLVKIEYVPIVTITPEGKDA